MSNLLSSNIFYNTQHSPLGAFASFTLGFKGSKGGLGLELGKPADQNVFIGVEGDQRGQFGCLPFYESVLDESTRFDIENAGGESNIRLSQIADAQISRTLTPGTDTWAVSTADSQSSAWSFTVHAPVMTAPNPATATDAELKLAYVPALTAELGVDNTGSASPRRVIFGFQNSDIYRQMRLLDDATSEFGTGNSQGIVGIATGDSVGIAARARGGNGAQADGVQIWSAQGFSAEAILSEALPFNRAFGIGSVGLLVAVIPAGAKVTLRFALCFYRGGVVTTGLKARYFYTRYFTDLESVAAYALDNFDALRDRSAAFDGRFAASGLSDTRAFMLSQAVHSYYGSSELLDVELNGKLELMWIVNEGEYRMINTFDLTADQLFFELELNPWTVRNELEWFCRRYSYIDTVRFPGDATEYPGGLTFTHDMGVANHCSPEGRSVYEKAGLHGCFSHMSHEELVNWAMCGLAYEHKTGDSEWLATALPVFQDVLTSMLNRDHPDPAQRDGVMSLDSSRCAGGSEITTYDSLDVSLGQSRNNLYLAVKCWGAYVGMEALFASLGDTERAAICRDQATRCAATVCASANTDGLLPAILHENVPSRIIPAIEGLITPHVLGLTNALSDSGPYGELIKALRRHLSAVLKPGICLFPDGAWKISSTSTNSWLSKVYLCQFIAERVLQEIPLARQETADAAHTAWLLDDRNSYHAWSDQMLDGVARGSKYYPRGVTSILWMT